MSSEEAKAKIILLEESLEAENKKNNILLDKINETTNINELKKFEIGQLENKL